MEYIDDLNKIVENYINEIEIQDMDDFIFLNRLMSIFDSHFKKHSSKKYKNRINIDKNYKYSYDFLNKVSPAYGEYLMNRTKEGVFDFVSEIENPEEVAFSTMEDGVKKIYMQISNTIEDSYTISHEIIHDMSLTDVEKLSMAREYFAEMFSLFIEKLQTEYFSSINNISDYKTSYYEMLNTIKENIEKIKIEQKLIEVFLDKNYINFADLRDILYSSDDKNLFEYVINEILNNQTLSVDLDQKYVIGYIFSCYLLDRCHERKDVQEFIELNDIINDYEIEDLLDYLDLELKEDTLNLDLTEESYKKLEKSYIKNLKNMW